VALKYFVLRTDGRPVMLARVDGLKVTDRILPTDPGWTQIRSLASLAWDSSGDEVSVEQAAKIASRWGASL
jgi:hypothetical protein